MKKVLMYPIWIRLWHWLNALLFFILILSGVSMQYSDTSSLLMPFEYAIVAHNICGILLSLVFLFYLIFNIKTKNYKQYIPHFKGMLPTLIIQAKYYIYGVFKGHPHPYETTLEQKFNPLQKLTYFGIMFFAVPAIIISGWLLMFPELAPEQILGMGGVWPMALLHISTGFFLNLFFIGHIYLATHGDTVGANFKSMINGWHLHSEHHSEEKHEEKIDLDEKQEIDNNINE